jgi:hypothetical protein
MDVFPMIPASRGYWWFFIPVAALLLGVLLLLGATWRGSRGARFEVSPAGLRLRGDVYGRLVPPAELRAAEARVVDLDAEPALAPRVRTMGTALPGYQSGWFRLRDGEKALLYLTDRRRAVYVPTTAGYALLLSPADPDGFVARLRDVTRQAGGAR